jgi:hypothetical protein
LDDKIVEGKTDSKGSFEIPGNAHEVIRISDAKGVGRRRGKLPQT